MPSRRTCLPIAERDDYVATRRLSGLSEVTVRIIERYVDEFLRFCEENSGHSEAKSVTRDDIVSFAEEQSKPGILKDTARLKVASVLGWLAWLVEQKRILNNPAGKVAAKELIP